MSKRSSGFVGLNGREPRALRRRAAQRARLHVGELDSRCCPSCTIQVVNGHILQIHGDQGANAVAVTEGNTGTLVICDGQNAGTFTGIDQINVNTFAGADAISIDGTNIAKMMDFHIDAGEGNDLVDFTSFAAIDPNNPNVQPSLRLDVRLGNGEDRFSMHDSRVAGAADIHIDAGADNDLVEMPCDEFVGLTNPSNALKLNVQLGAGEDQFSLHDSRVVGTADISIDAAAGGDLVEMPCDEFAGLKLNVRLGAGHDRFSLSESTIGNPIGETIGATAEISIDGEAGNDLVEFPCDEFVGLSTPSQFAALKLNVQMGAGEDIFSVTEGNFAGRVEMNVSGAGGKDVVVLTENNFVSVGEVIGGVPALIRVDLPGHGDGSAMIDDNTFGGGLSLNYAGGSGTDNISFTDNQIIGPSMLGIDLGGGDNVATIHMDTFAAAAALIVHGGNGADDVSLSCGAARGAFAADIDLGGGASSVTFEENDFGDSLLLSGRVGTGDGSFAFTENQVAGTADLRLELGKGHNTVAFPCNEFHAEAYIILVGAGGSDEVMFDENTVNGPLKLSATLGAGADMFVVDGNATFGTVDILADMGANNDEVMINVFGFADRDLHAVVHGGDGSDDLCIVANLPQGYKGAVDVRFFGEAGDDELAVKAEGDLSGVSNAFMLCDGGAGFDHCDVSPNVKVVNCES